MTLSRPGLARLFPAAALIAALGLPMPERAVGLSAHDFVQAANRPEVIMTRARRADGQPTVASRWLVRLETLLTGIGCARCWESMTERGHSLLRLGAALEQPEGPVPRAARPKPVPPRQALPDRLSVTEIETLVRDAYEIYAKRILNLRPLEPLARQPDARERGTVLHKVLEAFVHATDPWPGIEAAASRLPEIADRVLDAEPLPTDLRRIWRARIDRFAAWFIAQEDARRSNGTPAATEVPGAMHLPLPGEPFEIRAKADRIDRLEDGAAIYDYKTGKPPSNDQIANGLNHQLHIQGAILAAGGFDGLPALKPVLGAYIGLTGSDPGGEEQAADALPDEIPAHIARVAELIDGFRQGEPWVSRRRPFKMSFTSDYDHLARVDEWSGEDDP